MNDFLSKMKDVLDKSVEVSKEALSKAGDKMQDLGDKGMLKIEITQLEGRVKKCLADLGLKTYGVLSAEESAAVSCDDEQVSSLVAEINRLKKEIEEREKKFEKK